MRKGIVVALDTDKACLIDKESGATVDLGVWKNCKCGEADIVIHGNEILKNRYGPRGIIQSPEDAEQHEMDELGEGFWNKAMHALHGLITSKDREAKFWRKFAELRADYLRQLEESL